MGADLVALDGGLYLVGGSCAVEGGKLEPATSIERFDPAEQRWSTLVEKLPVALRHVQARA